MAAFVLSALLLVISATLKAETWKITSLEWPPYSGQDLPGQGTAIAELRGVLAAEGIDLEVRFFPWERAKRAAARPEYVGYFPAWPEEVRAGFIGSRPVQDSIVGVLYRIDQPVRWSSIMELFETHRVGLVQSYVYPDLITRAAQEYPDNVNLAPHEISLMRMLASGRMDVAITDPCVTLYIARRHGITNIQASSRPISIKPLVVAFHARTENLARIEFLNALLEPPFKASIPRCQGVEYEMGPVDRN
ncbi:MAG: hypothetical protein R3175_13590 [Marinobacter sp.]|uniref:substrate-binding periplasmic protein n=1 Tax=Marinobacter sp. TaxID=50741 RepID=UPI00299DA5AF|nr:hypothetical protein [Marinobacter sp.]MDX1757089.1 hypothetical protein [Marinobacter sp.]